MPRCFEILRSGRHAFGGWRNDNADVLDFGLCGEFLVGKDDEFGQGGFEEAFEGETQLGGENGDGGEALFRHRV